MRILLVSPYSDEIVAPILRACEAAGDTVTRQAILSFPVREPPDFVILWGYRRILSKEQLEGLKVINIHCSYLPWNRGASPNLWSWFDDTPKGVSIHEVTERVDRGPILAQWRTEADEDRETLRTSYDKLQRVAGSLFSYSWQYIRRSDLIPIQSIGGTYHNTWQTADLMKHFPKGWDTPVADIARMGREMRREMVHVS